MLPIRWREHGLYQTLDTSHPVSTSISRYRYSLDNHLDNHLGSVALEVDGADREYATDR